MKYRLVELDGVVRGLFDDRSYIVFKRNIFSHPTFKKLSGHDKGVLFRLWILDKLMDDGVFDSDMVVYRGNLSTMMELLKSGFVVKA